MVTFFDLETYCEAPIKHGLPRYMAGKPRIICIAAGSTEGDVAILDQLPPDHDLIAHSAEFERQVTGYNNVLCSRATALANGCPDSLDKLTRFLGSPHKKNADGKRLINKCCVPADAPPTREDMAKLAEYCCDDVRATISAYSLLRKLTPDELADYELCDVINQRGMLIDTELAQGAVELKAKEDELLGIEIKSLTGLKSKSVKLIPWVLDRLPDKMKILMYNPEADRYSLDTASREALLESPDLPADLSEVIELIDSARSSAAYKYDSMLKHLDYPGADGRLRGAYVFNGARMTGRYSSRGAQMHNLPRPAKDFNAEDAVAAIKSGDVPRDGLLKTLKHSLRSALVAPAERILVWVDLASIEARGVQWLASPDEPTSMLWAFKRGEDPYKNLADEMGFSRFEGKVATLACGYGGSVAAVMRMAKAYGVPMTPFVAQSLVSRWRIANNKVVRFWRALENAAVTAVTRPGVVCTVGALSFCAPRSDRLFMALPSGRLLTYWFPTVEEGEYGLELHVRHASLQPKAGSKHWPTRQLYGGLLAENATQAMCADLLRIMLQRAEDKGIYTVGHTHDEIIAECDEGEAPEVAMKLEAVMTMPVSWCRGLPLACEVQSGRRYRK